MKNDLGSSIPVPLKPQRPTRLQKFSLVARQLFGQLFGHMLRPSSGRLSQTLVPMLALAATGWLSACSKPQESEPGSTQSQSVDAASETIRLALFNVKELSEEKIKTAIATSETSATHPLPQADQALAAAIIVRRVRPDILVLQEVDQGPDEDPALIARQFADLLRSGPNPLDYPHVFSALSNTGRLSGIDLDEDGLVSTSAHVGSREHGNDSYGFGTYPGQYSMAVLSRFPIDAKNARTFQRLLWKDLPGHHLSEPAPPDGPLLSDEAKAVFRLSSKSHWVLPVHIGGQIGGEQEAASQQMLHLLISHPTPPSFDGPEDRNGRRNFDEIKLWAEYLDGTPLEDDRGETLRFGRGETPPFVVVGDLNAYPQQEDSLYDGRTAISQLLEHPLIRESGPQLTSEGAIANSGEPEGPPWFREQATTGFRKGVRIDYLLPSKTLEIVEGGVYWPHPEKDPTGAALAEAASDHRLLWLDLRFP